MSCIVRVTWRSGRGPSSSTKKTDCHLPRRSWKRSTRNCTLAGTGSYSIETLGDGRVLRLAGVPAVAAYLDYERIYVERGGKVYAGYQSKPSHTAAFRLNVEATDALFSRLGLATITP